MCMNIDDYMFDPMNTHEYNDNIYDTNNRPPSPFKLVDTIDSNDIDKYNNDISIDNASSCVQTNDTISYIHPRKGPRYGRGLKVLSHRVKSIIRNSNDLTCIQVADRLIIDNYMSKNSGGTKTMGMIV